MKTKAMMLACLSYALLMFNSLQAQISPDWKIIKEKENLDKALEPYRAGPAPGRSIKIGDLTNVVGDEKVVLTGFGIVSGLNGTGDSAGPARDMLVKVAQRQGIQFNAASLQGKNLALVSISAEVSPYQRTFDIAVKSIGDAKSLQNGFLEASTLSPVGSDVVYAFASGALSLGARYFAATPGNGAGATAGGATSVTIGHPTAAFVIDGGEVVKEIPTARLEDNKLTLFIKHPNERTSINISDSINRYMGKMGIEAEATSASTVTIYVPKYYQNNQGRLTQLIADINDMPATVSRRAIITIDQGSGVIAMTEGVKMEPGSITIAGITVSVSSDVQAVNKGGILGGNDFVEQPSLEVDEKKANFLSIPAGTDLRMVQETLNAMKLTPTSMISVFNAMHKAGMIHADLIILPK
ncbi:MAG: flagellar P-ring protein [Chlamydiales bacterium]|jgi:flagellar P-ring protein precursor FlgI|nr:flagellar P-ring protein [Chlamydiales bacterium]